MANMRDVAGAAKVSVSTVSSVLSGRKKVSPGLRQRVLDAVARSGYTLPACPLPRTAAPEEVCVILPGVHSSFFSPLLTGILDAASESGCSVQLFDSKRAWERESEILEKAAESGAKEVILDSVCREEREEEYFSSIQRRMLRIRGMRLVVLEREVSLEGIYSIYVDNLQAACQATAHLISLGHRRIAHIMGPEMFPHSHIRAEGYRQALRDGGIGVDAHLIVRGDYTPSSGYAAMSELFHKGIGCTAVFSANDQMAVGAIKAIHQQGFSVPEDIAVVGFDNLSVASLITPGLSTVQYPIYQMGYAALRILKDAADGADCPARTRLATRLVIRRSSDIRQTQDWNLHQW